MSQSAEYYTLSRRLAAIGKHLLPATFDPTGVYPDEVLDKTRGFVALAHAEIEAFVEARCLTVARECVNGWTKHRLLTPATFALYAMCFTGWTELGETVTGLPKLTNQHNVEARLNDALKQYEHVLGENHGIKEDNLKKLLVPLSVRMKSDLDSTWLATMSSFGANRGKIVHMTWKANQPPDPADSRNTIGKILLPGLRKLDAVLTTLLPASGSAILKVQNSRSFNLGSLRSKITGIFKG